MPLMWLSFAFLSGILLGEWLNWPRNLWLALAALALIVEVVRYLSLRYKPLPRRFAGRIPGLPAGVRPPISLFIVILFFFLGAARFQAARLVLTPGQIAWYNNQEIPMIVEGVLTAPPDIRDTYTNLYLQAEQMHPAGELLFKSVEGALLARVPPGGNWRYGDRIRLDGYLQTPAENEEFSYRDYLARQGIYSYLTCSRRDLEDCVLLLQRDQGNRWLGYVYILKERALQTIYLLFPDPEASLLAGIVLGIESGIPQHVQQAFKDTGTSHIIAISGFNFAIVAGLFAVLFGRLLGRWRGMLAAFLAIALYALLVGPGAAVMRAAIMGGLTLFAAQMGRRQHGLNSLAFVAALMALFNPHVLWDVGFQLSFMATLGLLLYAEPLSQTFVRAAGSRLPQSTVQRLVGPVGEYFLFTLAAQVTTLPVMLYHFQRFSLISFLANPLILPPQPPVMILGGLSTIAGMIYLPFGQVFAWLTWPFIVYTVRMVEWLAQAPGATYTLAPVSLFIVVLFYALLFAWTFAGTTLRQRVLSTVGGSWVRVGMAATVVLALITVVVWQVALAAPDGRLHLEVLDVGSGDALLLRTPAGHNLLIDGGPSPNRLSDALGRRLPLGRRKLDWLLVAATGEEQLAALPRTLERFPPEHVLWSGAPAGTFSARQLRQFLVGAGIPIIPAQAGQSLDLGSDVALRVLSSGSRGAILLLVWGRFSALLPIGLDFDSMQAVMKDNSLGPVSALLLAESGFAPLNTAEWVGRWQPHVVLLSVAADDRQGRPDPETQLAVQGYTLLRTDQNGWLRLSTNGEQLWVEVERR